MYNFVYTHENPEWPIDIFHRYYVHSQLSPSLIETKRFLITDEGVDDLQDKTFIYPNGKLDDVGEVVKRLLEKRNFILVFTFDHEAFWGDGIKDVHNFIDKYNFPFELISDPDESLCNLFDVIKEKSMYGKKYMGIERSTFLIDEKGKLVKEWRKVKIPGHVEEVLESISSSS